MNSTRQRTTFVLNIVPAEFVRRKALRPNFQIRPTLAVEGAIVQTVQTLNFGKNTSVFYMSVLPAYCSCFVNFSADFACILL